MIGVERPESRVKSSEYIILHYFCRICFISLSEEEKADEQTQFALALYYNAFV